MTTAHTPEPWGFGFLEEGCVCEKNGGGLVIHRSLDPEEGRRQFGRADLARIIACVNALAGIADPAEFVKRAKAIEAAASNAVPMMQMAWKQYGVGGMFECMDALRAALAMPGGAQS